MRFRKLRIAFSVTSGFACLLLIAMQLRSHWVNEGFTRIGSSNYYWDIASLTGGVRLFFGPLSAPHEPRGWKYIRKRPLPQSPGFMLPRSAGLVGIIVPYWFLILILGALAGVSAVRPYKVRLRTLLIATTLIAIVLGVIVYPATK
jgi:hypothetical protein